MITWPSFWACRIQFWPSVSLMGGSQWTSWGFFLQLQLKYFYHASHFCPSSSRCVSSWCLWTGWTSSAMTTEPSATWSWPAPGPLWWKWWRRYKHWRELQEETAHKNGAEKNNVGTEVCTWPQNHINSETLMTWKHVSFALFQHCLDKADDWETVCALRSEGIVVEEVIQSL